MFLFTKSRLAGFARTGVILAALAVPFSAAAAGAKNTSSTQSRWEPAIQKFEKQDQVTSPPQNGILFVGSSSIVGWDVKKAFPGKPVINRGFGGSQVSDVLEYFDRVVVPYKPEIVVLYSGDNDISGGKSPETVAADVKAFVDLVDAKVPSAKRIIIIPPKPSISRFKLWPEMKKVGDLEKALAESRKDVVVVDMAEEMMGADGQPKAELFKADKLHMTPAGYEVWNRKLLPWLEMAK